MKPKETHNLESAISDGFQSLAGAGSAVLMICTVGGAIPAAAALQSDPSGEDIMMLGLQWVWHWAVVGIMIWGLLAALIPVWCLYTLLHGSEPVLRVLAIGLTTQLIVSSIAIWTVEYGEDSRRSIEVSAAIASSLWLGPAFRRLFGFFQYGGTFPPTP